jgi:NADP-dependent 3-hydroxy acid dehydrogenase YdfG
MNKILIIGGSKGIGKASADYFSSLDYDVITMARTNADILGDITQQKVRDTLVESFRPDIVLVCAGMLGDNIVETMEVNYVAASDLISKFYYSLDNGAMIINLSSVAAMLSQGRAAMTPRRIAYNTSKNAVSNFCISLSRSKLRDVRVCTIEPEIVVPTDFSDFCKKPINPGNYENYDFDKFTPLGPSDIISAIEWIIGQPRWVNVCRITINNHFSHLQTSALR